jgi:hypothetical protein
MVTLEKLKDKYGRDCVLTSHNYIRRNKVIKKYYMLTWKDNKTTDMYSSIDLIKKHFIY